MKNLSVYDGELGMFREAPRPVDTAHLYFLRWLVERGRLEHPTAGPPCGELALTVQLARLIDETA